MYDTYIVYSEPFFIGFIQYIQQVTIDLLKYIWLKNYQEKIEKDINEKVDKAIRELVLNGKSVNFNSVHELSELMLQKSKENI